MLYVVVGAHEELEGFGAFLGTRRTRRLPFNCKGRGAAERVDSAAHEVDALLMIYLVQIDYAQGRGES